MVAFRNDRDDFNGSARSHIPTTPQSMSDGDIKVKHTLMTISSTVIANKHLGLIDILRLNVTLLVTLLVTFPLRDCLI